MARVTKESFSVHTAPRVKWASICPRGSPSRGGEVSWSSRPSRPRPAKALPGSMLIMLPSARWLCRGWHLFTSKWCTETSIKLQNEAPALLRREMIGKSIDNDYVCWLSACGCETWHSWSSLRHLWKRTPSKISYYCCWHVLCSTSPLKMSNWPFCAVNTVVSLRESRVSLRVW